MSFKWQCWLLIFAMWVISLATLYHKMKSDAAIVNGMVDSLLFMSMFLVGVFVLGAMLLCILL